MPEVPMSTRLMHDLLDWLSVELGIDVDVLEEGVQPRIAAIIAVARSEGSKASEGGA